MFTEKLKNTAEYQSKVNPKIHVNFGTFYGAVGSANLAIQDSFVGTAGAKLKEVSAGLFSDSEPLTKEAFNSIYGEDDLENLLGPLWVPFEEGLTKEQYELRRKYKTDRAAYARMSQDGNSVANFASGMGVGTLVDAPLMLIPYSAVAKIAKTAHTAARTGRSIAQTKSILDRTKTVDTILKNTAKGETSLLGNVYQLSKIGAAQQIAENSAVWYMSHNQGRDYGSFDFVADSTFGTAFGGILATPYAMKINATARAFRQDAIDRKALENFAAIGDLQSVVKHVAKYDAEYSGDLGAKISDQKNIERILNLSEDDYLTNPEAQKELKDFFYNNESDIWLRTLKTIIPLEKEFPVNVGRIKQQSELEAIVDSVVKGESNKLPSQLKQYVDKADEVVSNIKTKLVPEELTPQLKQYADEVVPEEPDFSPHIKTSIEEKYGKIPKDVIEGMNTSTIKKWKDHYFRKLDPDPYVGKELEAIRELKTLTQRLKGNFDELHYILADLPEEGATQKKYLTNNLEEFVGAHAAMHAHGITKIEGLDTISTPRDAILRDAVDVLPVDGRKSDGRYGDGWEPDEDTVFNYKDISKPSKRYPKPSKRYPAGTIIDGKKVGGRFKPSENIKNKIDKEVKEAKPPYNLQSVEKDTARLEKQLDQAIITEKQRKIQEDAAEFDALKERALPASTPLRESTEQSISKSVGSEQSSLLFRDKVPVGEWVESARSFIKLPYFRVARNFKYRTEIITGKVDEVFDTLDIDSVKIEEVGEEAYIRANQLLAEVESANISQSEAKQQLIDWAIETERTAILREIANYNATNRFSKKSKYLKNKSKEQALKIIKKFVDGRARKGVNLGRGSIASLQKSQIVKDISGIRSVLAKHKLIDLFDGDVSDFIKLPKVIKDNWEGKPKAEASEAFIEDILMYYRYGNTPERWSGESKAAFTDVAEAVKNTLHAQVANLNKHGAGIRLRDDHLGLTPTWNNRVVTKMGYDNFRSRLLEVIDWDKTEMAHGYIMPTTSKKVKGAPDEPVPFDKDSFIEQWFYDITSPKDPVDHWSQDLAKFFSHSRKVHILEGREFEVIKEFSGDQSLGRLLQDQIRRRSEMISVVETLGPKPLANFDNILRSNGFNIESTGVVDAAFGSVQRVRNTVRMLAGELDDPINADMSEKFKDFRRFSNLVYLPMSTASAITDLPIALMNLDQLGAKTNMKDLLSRVKIAASRRFQGSDANIRAFYDGSGASLDAIMNSAAGRLTLGEGTDRSFLSKASDAMFSLNGLNFWTGIMRDAFLDVMTESLAKQARSGDWNPHTLLSMESFGITKADLKELADSVEDINGVDRLGASSIKSNNLHSKMLEFMTHYMDEAVLLPDASTQSLVRFGLRAGTWEGEAVRTLFQYASFPLAMNRMVARNLFVNAKGDNPWTTGQISGMRMLVYAGSMLGISYVSTAIKDIAKLREPMMPWDINLDTTARVLQQSGALGVLEPLLETATGDFDSTLAPLPRTIGNSVASLFSEGAGSAIYDAKALYGGNVPILGPALVGALAHVADESIGKHYDQTRVYLESNWGTDFLID